MVQKGELLIIRDVGLLGLPFLAYITILNGSSPKNTIFSLHHNLKWIESKKYHFKLTSQSQIDRVQKIPFFAYITIQNGSSPKNTILSSPEVEAQVSFSDQTLSVVVFVVFVVVNFSHVHLFLQNH